ncbi:uncharacterized protein LOC119454526 isoform X3 [Dermacentor silvarum]|uniref:uncharacterized protein LOC119454526 isoform X3 n=1 Tax=Dermacentor silvarum TaxID=543639 RepID=UPI0021015028|nr:uncharacterized protein LOC119454526 isoform X3 [Dermacentor silvarum]
MGRPRVVRSEEEERALEERRREQKREWARKRREAEAAVRAAAGGSRPSNSLADEVQRARVALRLERRRQQQREYGRRRRANATDEERAAEAKRKRCARQDPEYREWDNARRRRGYSPSERFAGASNADPAAPRTPQCVVPVCHSRSAPSSILYPLPAKPSQRQAWIDFVRGCPCGGARDWNPPTNEISLVCSLHFAVRCFRFEQLRGCSMGWRKRLRRGAVPTLYPVEERCTLVANENSTADTASILGSSDLEGRTRDSFASSQSVAEQDGGHCASDQDAVRRLVRLAAFELIFPKDVSTQCSVEMASKAASCVVRTVSKSVQCSG